MTLLPPNATAFERALDAVEADRLGALPVPIGDVWSPERCPAQLLPWLAWGVSIDIWDTAWPEQVKRDAIAGAIEDQRRKGTKLAVRRALDRIDPLIGVTEWFEDPANLEPFTFRLDLPDRNTSEIEYDSDTIGQLLTDIAAVKSLRAHVIASYRIYAQAQMGVVSGVTFVAFARVEADADLTAAEDPVWQSYLQSEIGEPLRAEAGAFLESA
ncbi:phage tail protein I [Erythrobacter sp. CCH5-A1]|uniref:phage tail protein I n=1 Tax=Erythrobacter sp. CCH5-A1 TaxID=1768792 RepID=UPI0008319A21|nr:phage tail protein I [Erythrobacter sp. CCH5-A1]